ncbi:MAG TPA: GIY-YIG nuclease family protein [Candidatus Omnitrophota bacterium]|nr:GIY-YIG nuclease family protein [Candidatus Omnitrophota bacterium]
MWYVYILKSLKTGRYYVGYAEDLEKRLEQHNSGKTRLLKSHLPLALIYNEKYASKSEAYLREKKIKSYKSGEAFRRLIRNQNLEACQSG